MRLLRAAVFAAVCVLLAAAGHSLASGRAVPPLSLLLGWVAVLVVAVPLAGRERRLPGIAGLLAVGELGLHVVFSTGQMCSAVDTARQRGSADALMTVAARLVCGGGRPPRLTPATARQLLAQAGISPASVSSSAATGHAGMAGMTMPSHGGGALPAVSSAWSMLWAMCSPAMLLGHLVAAVAAGWLLRRGEAALWRLVRLSVRGATGLGALAPVAGLRAYALLAALTAAGTPGPRRRPRSFRAAPARHRTVWLRHCMARRGPPALALAA